MCTLLIFILSASLHCSEIDSLRHDIIGLLVTKIYCGQSVHPRPIEKPAQGI